MAGVDLAAGSGANPHMNPVIADTVVLFTAGSTAATNYTTGDVSLPDGERIGNEDVWSGVSAAPEPASIGIVSGAAVLPMRRRRRPQDMRG